MINERIQFEIELDSTDDMDVCTKALVIFEKHLNLDSSRKVISYQEHDEAIFSLLEKTHDLPQDLESMTKYIAAPMMHQKSKKSQFHTRFRSVTSLLEIK